VRIRVVVQAVVLVVPARGDHAVEQLLHVRDATGLVLHRRDRDRRAGGERRHQPALDAGRVDHSGDPLGQIDDVVVAGRFHPQHAAVDGHGQISRIRANRRLPS
jgi:hypothetical protein